MWQSLWPLEENKAIRHIRLFNFMILLARFFSTLPFLQTGFHSLSMLLQLFSNIEVTFHFINISKSTIKKAMKICNCNSLWNLQKQSGEYNTLLITITIRILHVFLQGIFLTQGSNQSLLHCRQNLYHWTTWEAPQFL